MGKENLDILTEKYIFFPDFHPLRFSCFVAQEGHLPVSDY